VKKKPCEEYGHIWKMWRKAILTTEEGSKQILYFRCKICGFKFDNSDDEELEFDEKDYIKKRGFENE
jgi:hypothetical protein